MHDDHFISIQKPENEVKQKAMSPRTEITTPAELLDAITWAANQAGKTYGQFSCSLTEEEKAVIIREYRQWQEDRKAEIRERMKSVKNNRDNRQ